MDLDNHADDIDMVKQIRQIIGVEEVLAPMCYYDYFSEEEQGKQIIAKIPKEKLNEVLEKKLLLSNHESYANNQESYVMSNGVSSEFLEYVDSWHIGYAYGEYYVFNNY